MIAGEDANDRQALRVVLEAACADMRGRLVEINDAARLCRAHGDTLKKRVNVLHRKALARAEREQAQLACVFVHEDWDAVDGPKALEARVRVQRALDDVAGQGHYVLAVWEVEAWLLMFPDAVRTIASSWSVPPGYVGRDTGLLQDPKKIMRSRCASGARSYRESDSVKILKGAAATSELDQPAGTNRSWTWLWANATTCCEQHLGAGAEPQRGSGG